MLKTDHLGEYDDEQIPLGLSLPMRLDEGNDAVTFADNTIFSRYGGATIDESVLLQEKRKAEFVLKLANGELIVRKDKAGNDRIFRRGKQNMLGSKIAADFTKKG